MLTVFGKALRNFRMDNGLILKEMAEMLGCSSAFLSAVEFGDKKIPRGFVEKIRDVFNLDNLTYERFKEKADLSAEHLQIDMKNKSEADKVLATTFARRFDSLSEKEKDNMRKMLSGGENID